MGDGARLVAVDDNGLVVEAELADRGNDRRRAAAEDFGDAPALHVG